MAIYSKHLILNGHLSAIDSIATAIKEEFTAEGYDVMVEDLVSGGSDISITKGGVFKAVLGMKSAMKYTKRLLTNSKNRFEDAVEGLLSEEARELDAGFERLQLTNLFSLSIPSGPNDVSYTEKSRR